MKILKIILKFIGIIWQLPQFILGCFVIFFTFAGKRKYTKDGMNITYFLTGRYTFGVSLYFPIIGTRRDIDEKVIRHEYGHCIQSRILGPLYLFIVGIPSAIRNIYDRIAHNKWTYTQRYTWYYSSFPEKQADKLGKVKR